MLPRRRRLTIVALLAAGAVAAGALFAPAYGAFYLLFRTASDREPGTTLDNTRGIAAPGSVVVAYTGGHGAMGDARRMPAFLVRAGDYHRVPQRVAHADALDANPLLTEIGALKADEHADGHLRFVVPDLPPAHYEILAFCKQCAELSFGHNVAPMASLVITGGEALPATGSAPGVWLIASAILAGAGFFLWWQLQRPWGL